MIAGTVRRGRKISLLLAGAGVCLLAAGPCAAGQQTTTANQTSPARKFNCLHPANPHRRQLGCADQDFDWDETLAGGWNDIRRITKRIGIVPTASYVGALETNVTGGRDQVWSYAGQLSFGANADLGELLNITGLSAYVGASWGTGSNLAGSLGSLIPTTGLYAPSFYLGEMYLQQKLVRGKITMLAGRLAPANTFAALPVFANYVNYGINPNPFSLGANDLAFFSPPAGTEWGAQASYTVTPSIQISAGAFNTNLHSANGDSHGADFTLQEGNKGVLAAGEIDYLRNQSTNSVGKPGQITCGFLHSNNSFSVLNSPGQSDGYSGAYLLGQQMVFRPGGAATSQGATVWGTWSRNSKELISPVPLFWGGGFSYEGLIPARKNDVISVGLIRAAGSKYAQPTKTEELLELNYQWTHSRYMTVTPHAQYLWNTEGHEGRNATVLGIQLSITL
jgi:porin